MCMKAHGKAISCSLEQIVYPNSNRKNCDKTLKYSSPISCKILPYFLVILLRGFQGQYNSIILIGYLLFLLSFAQEFIVTISWGPMRCDIFIQWHISAYEKTTQ